MDNQVEVVVYVKENCAQCRATTRWLDKNEIPYRTEDATQNVGELKEEGFSAVPVVKVNDSSTTVKAWSGYRPDQLKTVADLLAPSEDGAFLSVKCWANGQEHTRMWKDNQGRLHNLNGPAFEEFDYYGFRIREQHVVHGTVLDDRTFWDDGTRKECLYSYHDDGAVKEIRTIENGLLEGKKAVERFDRSGRTIYVESWEKGKMTYAGRTEHFGAPKLVGPVPKPRVAVAGASMY